MAIQTYNKEKIDELFALRYVASTSLIKDLDLDDYEDKAIIINQENGKQYQLDKNATATADLGKWKELASDAVIAIDAIPTADIKTNIIYYLKQDYEVLVDGKWVKYRAGFYYAIKNEDGTYTWERVSKDTFVQKVQGYVLIDGVKYPKLSNDLNEAYYVYLWLTKGYQVLITYDEVNYYNVISAEWNSGSGANAEFIVEYIGGHYLIRSGRVGYTTIEEHYDIAADAIISVDALPTSNIQTNCFYYLKAKVGNYNAGLYYATKNADNTYKWTIIDDDLYMFKATQSVTIDGVAYPTLRGDVNYGYRLHTAFKEGKRVVITYDEVRYYEVINAETKDGDFWVEYIGDKWLIKSGNRGATTFEEHYNLIDSDALESVDALPTSDIKTSIFYRLKADTADHKAGVYYAVKNADNTYTWAMIGDDVYILKATNSVTLDGVVYPTLRGDVNFAYRCYENFKAGKTVFVTYDEKNLYEVINAEYVEDGGAVPNVYVEYICGNWLIKTGSTSGASTFEEHYDITASNALESVDALPTSDIKTSIFYRLKDDTTDNKKGIYYAVKNADDTYTWTMVDDDTYIFKATKFIGIEGIAYPSLEGDVNYAYRCYENFKAGKTVLLTYDEKNYYRVNAVKYYEDGGLGPNVFVEYLATYWLVTTGATSSLHTYATYSKFMTKEALTTVTALPTSDIYTNIFYRLTTDTAEHPAGIYYAVKNADGTYTWNAVGGGGGGGETAVFTMTQVKLVWNVYVYYPTFAQFKEILSALKAGKDVWVTSTSSNHYMSRVTTYRTGVSPYAEYFTYEYETYRIEVYQGSSSSETLTVIPWNLTTGVVDDLISTDTEKALSAKQGNTLYQTKLGFVNDLTATTIANLWTWANGEETKDFLKLHQRTFKFSTSSECPKGTSTSDVFVATIYTNTSSYGYIRAINYNTGVEYNNYNNNGTWSGWWNSSFEANKHQTMTRTNMWNLGDGIYTNVTWNSSDYPVGVTSTGTTTTVMVTGNTAHNYGTLTCFDQGAGKISICSVQNNVVQSWREVISNYGTGTLTPPSGVTISDTRMFWYDAGNTRIVHLSASLKGVSVSAHSGKLQGGFALSFSDGKKFFVNNSSTGCLTSDLSAGLTISVIGRSTSTANNDFSMSFFNAYTSSVSTSKTMNFGITLICTTT